MKLRFGFILLLSSYLLAQGSSASASDETVALVQNAATRALNFEQGDGASLTKARADFTPQGWKEYIKHMEGFLDPNGAAQFTSKFVPAGNAAITDRANGIVRLKIPGTLTQTQGKSSTTYRLRIEVQAAGVPPKIEHLEQITCDKASAVTYCI